MSNIFTQRQKLRSSTLLAAKQDTERVHFSRLPIYTDAFILARGDLIKVVMDVVTDTALRTDLNAYINTHPDAADLFTRLIEHLTSHSHGTGNGSAPASKKRKLFSDKEDQDFRTNEKEVATIHDVTFTLPIRKKAHLVISDAYLYILSPPPKASAASTPEQVEYRVRKQDIARIVAVPTPEKSTNHWTFCIFAKGANDPVCFGVNERGKLKITIHGAPSDKTADDRNDLYITRILQQNLPKNIRVISPATRNALKPAIQQASSASAPGTSWHIFCYLKTKEGFLYFFDGGLLFGLKKPMVWIDLGQVLNALWLGRTSRTANLCLVLKQGQVPLGDTDPNSNHSTLDLPPEFVAYEFSMIDAAETSGIESYMGAKGVRFVRELVLPGVQEANGTELQQELPVQAAQTIMSAPLGSDDEDDADFKSSEDEAEAGNKHEEGASDDEHGSPEEDESSEDEEEEDGDSEEDEEEVPVSDGEIEEMRTDMDDDYKLRNRVVPRDADELSERSNSVKAPQAIHAPEEDEIDELEE
ncbi:hypothetical protein BZG36_04560 [Bifiguratus adelaidae]|uniref:Histone chaperone RTT106/FACT complex subunit SPT16-like middle domain-containing protein n=1 Tax=Bifiguratus adelaidae TaxID=1938954 RepID=A0A261XX44_9FUNG|nr:hypothetical protein BZG36_04560 [Bifiguratus adelaidae]